MENKTHELIVSVATTIDRFDMLKLAIKSVLEQTIFDLVKKFYINVTDDLSKEDYEKYDSLKAMSDKIEIQVCPQKWRSANKLIWTYKKHHDDVIIAIDDDIYYPSDFFEDLYNCWLRNQNCIVAYEINPVCVVDDKFVYLHAIDVKLLQRGYGKYLTNGCLFCPNCFSEKMLYDFDTYFYVTKAMHDEIWFWIMSTLNNTHVIGLNSTYSLSGDDKIDLHRYPEFKDKAVKCLAPEITTKEAIQGFNDRINEVFHDELKKVIDENYVDFFIDNMNVLAFTGNLHWVNTLYKGFNIRIIFSKKITKSWISYVIGNINNFSWRNVVLAQCQ